MTARTGESGQAGLCEQCVHHSVVLSRRGNRFHRCGRSKTDPSYPKYPRLPVLQCGGFVSSESGNGRRNDTKEQ
jgi:hypothetical protein